jgi:glycerophosphoryl diester phosphodiesterase
VSLSIAHRGEPVGHRENTVEAVAAALDAGAEMVEIDVRLTADGAPVLLHDAELTRLWGVDRLLSELTLDQVQQLKGPGGERIPGLQEIAELVTERDRQIMVDLPAADAGPVAFDLLERLGVLDAMLFAGATGSLRAHSATARIALSWDALELPDEALLAQRRPEYFNPYFRLLTAGIADQMHERGMRVSVWTVDHPGDMAAAIAQGADAIISNRIDTLTDVIRNHCEQEQL